MGTTERCSGRTSTARSTTSVELRAPDAVENELAELPPDVVVLGPLRRRLAADRLELARQVGHRRASEPADPRQAFPDGAAPGRRCEPTDGFVRWNEAGCGTQLLVRE